TPQPGQLARLMPWRRQLAKPERLLSTRRGLVGLPHSDRRPVSERRVHPPRRFRICPPRPQLRRGPAARPWLEPAGSDREQGHGEAVTAQEATNHVQVAAHHWRPRFVANGIDVNDFDNTVRKTAEWKDWGPNWRTVGQMHESLAREARERGKHLSAPQPFQRARWGYHLGKFLWFEDQKIHAELRDRSVAVYREALPQLDPEGERLEIPFEGHVIPANLRRPDGRGRRPLVLIVPGLDSSKEELYA